MELATADKIVHTDFYNSNLAYWLFKPSDKWFLILFNWNLDFDDLFDDDNYN